MESALSNETASEIGSDSHTITSDKAQCKSEVEESDKQSISDDLNGVGYSIMSHKNCPVNVTNLSISQQIEDTASSLVNEDECNNHQTDVTLGSVSSPMESCDNNSPVTCQSNEISVAAIKDVHIYPVVEDLLKQVVGAHEQQSCDLKKVELKSSGSDQISCEVMLNGSSAPLEPSSETNAVNQCEETVMTVVTENVQQPPERELSFSLGSLEKSKAFFEMGSRLPQVVIDLRQPPLVQVCTLYSSVENSAATSSSSNGTYNSVSIPHRPQTAIRGRRLHSNHSMRQLLPPQNRYSSAETSNQTIRPNSDDDCQIVQADTPDQRVVATSARRSLRSAGKTYQGKNDIELDEATIKSSKRCRKTSEGSGESDEDTMKVQAVNRTYARYSYTPHTPVMSTSDIEAKILERPRFSSSIAGKDNWQNQHYDVPTKKLPRHVKSPIPIESSRVEISRKSTGPEKSKLNKSKFKTRARIGPAWYSRKFLSSPPRQSNHLERTILSFSLVKRQIYVLGQRHFPLPRNGKLPLIKKTFRVQPEETSEFDNIGHESLMLWCMSSADVEELQSQLLREAEHRRVDRAMPVVMQLSDDQIETAYKRVAESMNTFEIVAADSDEEEAESDEEDTNEEDKYQDILGEYHRMVAEREKLEEEKLPVFETEYARCRPKRLAVDYGPSAFAPILLMEGRRLSSGHSINHKPMVTPKLNTKIAGRESRAEESRKRKKKVHRSWKVPKKQQTSKTEDAESFLEIVSTGPHASQHGSVDAKLVSRNHVESVSHSSTISERRCLFDELSHPLENPNTAEMVIEAESAKKNAVKSNELLHSDSSELVGVDAPELSVPPGVNDTSPCSPPPDLGLPMS